MPLVEVNVKHYQTASRQPSHQAPAAAATGINTTSHQTFTGDNSCFSQTVKLDSCSRDAYVLEF